MNILFNRRFRWASSAAVEAVVVVVVVAVAAVAAVAESRVAVANEGDVVGVFDLGRKPYCAMRSCTLAIMPPIVSSFFCLIFCKCFQRNNRSCASMR